MYTYHIMIKRMLWLLMGMKNKEGKLNLCLKVLFNKNSALREIYT